MPVLSPLFRFPGPLPVYCLPFPSRNEICRRARVDDLNERSGISPGRVLCLPFLTVWGILVQSALVPHIRNT